VIRPNHERPKSLQRALKTTDKVRRPLWHYTGVVLLTYVVLSFVVAFVEFQYYESKIEEEFKAEQQKEDNYRATRQADVKAATMIPTYESDSIAYRIMTDFDFSQWGVNPKDLGYATKQKGKRLLAVINFKERPNITPVERNRMLYELDDFLFNRYANQLPVMYLTIAINGKAKDILEPPRYFHGGYEEYYFESFYDDDEAGEVDMTQIEGEFKKRALLKKVRENVRSSQLDSVILTQKWNQMRQNFDFTFFQEPIEIGDTYKKIFLAFEAYEIPRELELLSNLHNGEGPFTPIIILTEPARGSRDVSYDKMINNSYEDEEGKMMPFKTRYFRKCIYDDYAYAYYLDLAPGPNGKYGQIFMQDQNNKRTVVADDLIEFIDLFNKKKLPVDLKDWVKYKRKASKK
jgi:hypothetical protein